GRGCGGWGGGGVKGRGGGVAGGRGVTRARTGGWGDGLRRLGANRLSVAGGVIVLALVAAAVLAPHLGLADPVKLNVAHRFSPPGAGHWFRADTLGRDGLRRVPHGARFGRVLGRITYPVAAGPCTGVSRI